MRQMAEIERQPASAAVRRRFGIAALDRCPTPRSVVPLFAAIGCIAIPILLGAAAEQNAIPSTNSAARGQTENFLYFLLGGGGVIGMACTIPILCMSVAAIAMFFEHLITLRRSVLMPHGLAEDAHEHISSGAFTQAEQLCKLRPSVLSEVIHSGLQEVRLGFAVVQKAMEDALQAQSARLLRKIEFLSVIANISTLLGLFGTVVGLVLAFKKVADTQGAAKASDLASGIYLALMTTIEGLAIAIPTVGAYAIFRHRADQLIAEAALLAEYAFSGYKRNRLRRRPTDANRTAKSGPAPS